MSDLAQELAARLRSGDEEERRRAVVELPPGWHAGVLPLLVEAMGDASWRVRKDALARVAAWPDVDGAVAMLISTLSDDSNVGLRNAAVEALAQIGEPCVKPLAMALEAGGDHRKFLVDALAAIGPSAGDAVPALLRSLDDPDDNVRAAAAEALGRTGGREAVSALRARLGGPDLLSRLAALEALNHLEAELDPSLLVPMLAEPVLRRAALEALGLSGDLAALPHLVAALRDRVRAVRETAEIGLVRLHEVQAAATNRATIEQAAREVSDVKLLAQSMSSDRGEVRRAAATLLGWTRRADAVAPLVEGLRDEETGETAGASLAALGPAAVETLIGVLRDEDAQASAVAARVLGELEAGEAIPALTQILDRDDDPAIALAAARALGRIGVKHPAAVRDAVVGRPLEGTAAVHLCRVLASVGRDEDAMLRRAAARTVSALGPHRDVVEALIYALADEEPLVRSAAADTLGSLNDASAVQPLAGALRDDDESVRASAARALGRLGDAAAAAALRPLAREHAAARMYAIEALAKVGEPDDVDIYVEALDANDPEVVKAAVRALGGLGATASLRGALGHPRWDVRRVTAEALAPHAADPGVADALRARAKVEEDPMVREVIEAALQSR